MRFVFAGYIRTGSFHSPEAWLFRLRAYTGVLDALAERHEVISIEQIAYTGTYRRNNVWYYFLDLGKPVLRFPFRLHRFIRRQKPDVVLIHGSCFPWQVWQLRKTLGKRVKIIVQDHSPGAPAGYRQWLQRMADPCIDRYFFTSEMMSKEWLRKKLIGKKEKIREIMVGSSVFPYTDRQTARSHTGIKNHKVFLWVGRLDKNKDPQTVISAFLRFAECDQEAALYMIHQSDEGLTRITEHLGKQVHGDRVHMVGSVPHNDMQYWFNSADFLVAGSHFEVYGAAVVEAMSCGCIPILSDIPSFRKISADGVYALLFPPGDSDALTERLADTGKMDILSWRNKVKEHFQRSLSFNAIACSIEKAVQS